MYDPTAVRERPRTPLSPSAWQPLERQMTPSVGKDVGREKPVGTAGTSTGKATSRATGGSKGATAGPGNRIWARASGEHPLRPTRVHFEKCSSQQGVRGHPLSVSQGIQSNIWWVLRVKYWTAASNSEINVFSNRN